MYCNELSQNINGKKGNTEMEPNRRKNRKSYQKELVEHWVEEWIQDKTNLQCSYVK